MKVKEESEKVGLKLNIQKTKIMASDPITSWQVDGETMETVADFIFFGSNQLSELVHTHAQSCLTLCNLWIIACQVPLSMGLSRQEYQSGLPCPPPGDIPGD